MPGLDGLKLKKLRIERGVTQYQLAIQLGLYPSQVSRIERGKQRLTRHMAIAAAAVLGVDPSVFGVTDIMCQSVDRRRKHLSHPVRISE